LRTAPKIDKLLLSNPKLITREYVSRGRVPFSDDTWIGTGGRWDWDRLVKNTDSLPTDLPPKRKGRLLEKMPTEKRNDPNFVAEYLKRKLDRYRKSKMYRFAGSIRLSLCVSPNSQAACDYLIYYHRGYSAPPELIAGDLSESNHLKDLGTIGFSEQSDRPEGYAHVMFVRDNIAVIIDARGELASEALPFAHKIDSLIQKQPGLTYEQLLARRPSIKIDPEVIKSKTGEKTVSYNISAPAGQQIVDVKAYVNDQSTPVRNGKIHIIRKTGKVKVKVVATTSELLTNTFEKEVNVPE